MQCTIAEKVKDPHAWSVLINSPVIRRYTPSSFTTDGTGLAKDKNKAQFANKCRSSFPFVRLLQVHNDLAVILQLLPLAKRDLEDISS